MTMGEGRWDSGVDVVIGQRLFDRAQRNAVGNQLVGIQLHLVFALGAAENIHVDDVGYRFELVQNEPILQRLQIDGVVLGLGAGEGIENDLPRRTVIRIQSWVDTCLKGDKLQTIEDFLTSIEGSGVVVVNDGDDR